MPAVSKCTPRTTKAIAANVEAGLPFRDACALAGVSRQAAYDWIAAAASDPDGNPAYVAFSDALAVARARFKIDCLQDVRAGRPGWQSRAWLLERLFPEDFGTDRRLLRAIAKFIEGKMREEEKAPSQLPRLLGSETDPDGMDDSALSALTDRPSPEDDSR